MRNLGASPYLENPELVEIKAVAAPDKSGNRVNEFNMNISIKRAQPEDAKARRPRAAGQGRRGRNEPARRAANARPEAARQLAVADQGGRVRAALHRDPGRSPGSSSGRRRLDAIEKGRQDVAKQKETFLEKKKLAVNLDAYKQQRAEIEQSFGALLKQLPNKSEMDALLIDINQAGLGRGLRSTCSSPPRRRTSPSSTRSCRSASR